MFQLLNYPNFNLLNQFVNHYNTLISLRLQVTCLTYSYSNNFN